MLWGFDATLDPAPAALIPGGVLTLGVDAAVPCVPELRSEHTGHARWVVTPSTSAEARRAGVASHTWEAVTSPDRNWASVRRRSSDLSNTLRSIIGSVDMLTV